MPSKGFIPQIEIRDGKIEGYGGPGLFWTKGVYDNHRLYYIESRSETDAAIRGERQRVKWKKRWPSKEAFLKAISRKPLDTPLCSNCGNPGATGTCLDRDWCDRPACREALEAARRKYHEDVEHKKAEQASARERQQQKDIEAVNRKTKCFHWQDGWFFRREKDGSVRIMHRERPDSEWLKVDIVIPEPEWASIVCSVSAGGEDSVRWEAARHFHNL